MRWLLGLIVLGWRLFLVLEMVQLMSEERLRMRLVFELAVLLGGPLGCLLLGGEVLLVLIQRLGLCMSRSIGLRSLCTHSFSIIDGLLFLL